jgi:hypothetical protein
MPLARYFLCVGGALMALLFVIGAELPKLPAAQVANTAADLPMIRIHTDRKWPERVVFDTSIPAGIGPVAITGDLKTGIAAKANIAKTGAGAATALIKVSDGLAPDVEAKVRVREAFAQFRPTEPKQLQPLDPKKPELKRPVKRKVARRHTAPSTMMVAQQPPFGFFGKNIW